MIAGGEGHNAASLFLKGQAADAIVGAAKLEGPGALQRLGLHQNPTADRGVQGGALDQGRADGDALDLAGGVQNAFIAGPVRGHMLP